MRLEDSSPYIAPYAVKMTIEYWQKMGTKQLSDTLVMFVFFKVTFFFSKGPAMRRGRTRELLIIVISNPKMPAVGYK